MLIKVLAQVDRGNGDFRLRFVYNIINYLTITCLQLYEDVEFGLLEEEAGWLARREELHRDRAAAVAIRRARRARAEWLRAQIDQLRSVGEDQIRALRTDVNTATLSIQQVQIAIIDAFSSSYKIMGCWHMILSILIWVGAKITFEYTRLLAILIV